jgi:CheY-like chemotaxis protein
MASRRASSHHRRPPRILVVEDELLIALMIEEMVKASGYRVAGVVHTSAALRERLTSHDFDVVLLDLSIEGQYDPTIADLLAARGVPFAFLTGYDYIIEPRHENIPLLQKPFRPAQLSKLLTTLAGPSSYKNEAPQTASQS